ncbi:MAG: hypothetical protein IVW36_11525 [Dehalococcoidia bacterium]|nr:hypothetical protein [Dehalococcoidia bacterium]
MNQTERRPAVPARVACLIAAIGVVPTVAGLLLCYFLLFARLTVNQTLLASLLFALVASAYATAVQRLPACRVP